MTHLFRLKLLALAISSTLITACGDAETNIVEKDPIEVPDDGHDHGDGGDHGAKPWGARLSVAPMMMIRKAMVMTISVTKPDKRL